MVTLKPSENPFPENTFTAQAHIIPIQNGLVGVAQCERGLFLIGGGIEEGESPEQTIRRDALEETGRRVILPARSSVRPKPIFLTCSLSGSILCSGIILANSPRQIRR